MRFLFECVGCCTINTPKTSSPETQAAEETRSLVAQPPPPAPPVGPRRKRSSSSMEWKPSLFAISEDNAIMVAPAKIDNRNGPSPVAVADRSVKRCGPSSVRVNSSRSNARDFSRDTGPIVIPSAFTAAPFMF